MSKKLILVALVISTVLAGTAYAETIKLPVSDWADVVRPASGGEPSATVAGSVAYVGYWGPTGVGDHYAYVKFDIPEQLAGTSILGATFHAYNLGFVSEYKCRMLLSYIPNDEWSARSPAPFPMYRERRVLLQRPLGDQDEWYDVEVGGYLFMPGEGPGQSLTIQLEQGGPGRRGMRLAGPSAADPAKAPYLEIVYADIPPSGPRILIAEETCGALVWNAARVLKQYVEQATGQTLPIVPVGRTDPLPQGCLVVDGDWLAARAGADPKGLAYDGFIVANRGGRLVLTGAPERGVLYAVMDYLERDLGYRWYSAERIVIPRGKTLALNVPSRREEPAFEVRWPYVSRGDIYHAARRFTHTSGVWGQNPSNFNLSPHSLYTLAPPKTYFDEHPEWYSYQNGIWFTGQVNCHNQDLIKVVADGTVEALTLNPDWPKVYVSQRDGLGWSQDPVTNAFDAQEGSTTASMVYFVNQVAAAVAQAHPDRQVMTLAYHYTLTPPRTLSYAPNVVLFICTPWTFMGGTGITDAGPFGQYYLEMLKDWAKKCEHPYAWMYHMQGWNSLSTDTKIFAPDYRALRAAGVKGVFAEFGKRDAPYHDLRMYLVSKLWWNPDADAEAVVRDFHEGYYGRPAGRKMLEYYYAVTAPPKDPGSQREWLEQLEGLVSEARGLARGEFARRKIDETMRAVVAQKLFLLTTQWEISDGHVRRQANTPEAQTLLARIEGLAQSIGDEKSFTREQFTLDQRVLVLDNGELEVLVLPEMAGSLARIRDLKTGLEVARLVMRKGPGYKPAHVTYPLLNAPLEVQVADSHEVKLTGTWKGRSITKKITLSATGPSFQVSSRMTQDSPEPASDAFMTRLVFQVGGNVADGYLVYRDGQGKMHSKLLRNSWECMSGGWGPTGLVAVIDPQTNRGLVWELDQYQNGGWFRVYPHPQRNAFEFDLYGERARTGSGEPACHDETITILRDARAWCARHGVTLEP